MNDLAVLIPVFNAEDALLRTLGSIDPAEHVDVVVVDDGSVPPLTREPIRRAFRASGEVHLISGRKNTGITGALNDGLDYILQCGYQYVGRLDAGDVNLGPRFARQRTALETTPELAIVGCWVDFVDEKGASQFVLRHPTTDQGIRSAIRRFNPFVHPAVSFRAQAMDEIGGYPADYPALEDWAAFFKLLERGRGANLPEVLVRYEISPRSISSMQRFRQGKSKLKLLLMNFDGTVNATAGIVKTALILLLPRAFLTSVKRSFLRKLRS